MRTGGENMTKKLVGRGKDKAHQLLSLAKQTQLGEINLFYFKLITE